MGHRNSKHIHSCTLSQASIGKDVFIFGKNRIICEVLDQSLDSQLIMRLLVSHPWKTQACRQSINSTCSAFVQNI